MGKLIIILFFILLIGCEEHIDVHEYYTIYDADTDTDTDCIDDEICSSDAYRECMITDTGVQWLYYRDSCYCDHGVQKYTYLGQICLNGCASVENGLDYCVGYGPDGE